MTKKTESSFLRAQNLSKANSQKKEVKTDAPKHDFRVVVTGNRKPKTGNQKKKMGPWRFELQTYGCLRTCCIRAGHIRPSL